MVYTAYFNQIFRGVAESLSDEFSLMIGKIADLAEPLSLVFLFFALLVVCIYISLFFGEKKRVK